MARYAHVAAVEKTQMLLKTFLLFGKTVRSGAVNELLTASDRVAVAT